MNKEEATGIELKYYRNIPRIALIKKNKKKYWQKYTGILQDFTIE